MTIDIAKEKINELEGIAVETVQNQTYKNKFQNSRTT